MAGLLGAQREGRRTLAEMFEAGEMVLAPGCYDALGARLIEHAGFGAAYMTGFGSAASRLGRPDIGLMSMSEMVDNARRIVEAVDIPVVADADTGYGNAINVIRTVREYEAAGVAAIHLEDQVMPKKCGHMEDKQLVPPHAMASKIAAAAAARRSPDFLIIARTDARAVEGLEAAFQRGRRYREAGADALFVEAPQSVSEIEAIAEEFPDVPLLFNYAEGGKTPAVEYDFLRELGFSLVIFPLTLLLSATKAMRTALARVKADGTPIGLLPSLIGFEEFLELVGMDEIRELEHRFAEA
ncbi:MAG TPA: oxaloacetate decarboxylase [Solirubrobacteraceae bacterium]|nr:oxaloacetate decarboxylase [Solirubrobacteraceae bacterium]